VCLAAPVRAHDPINGTVTWNGDINRIVQTRCASCHVAGGRGPMPLTSYEAARPWARAIREEVVSRRMPKWHAARGYGQFANDRSLTPFEIALIVAWVDGGAVRGPQPSMPAPIPENSAPVQRRGDRTIRLRCGTQPLPAGRLLAVRPQLGEHGSAGIQVAFPDGRREVVAWIRDFEKKFAETYWLRTPIDVPPGSNLQIDAGGKCRVTAVVSSYRTATAKGAVITEPRR
jgi:hypothetical protein